MGLIRSSLFKGDANALVDRKILVFNLFSLKVLIHNYTIFS
jgi:hypothetical protein